MLENESILRTQLRVLVKDRLTLERVPPPDIISVDGVEVPDDFKTALYDVRIVVGTDPSSETAAHPGEVTSEGALRRPGHLPCWF